MIRWLQGVVHPGPSRVHTVSPSEEPEDDGDPSLRSDQHALYKDDQDSSVASLPRNDRARFVRPESQTSRAF